MPQTPQQVSQQYDEAIINAKGAYQNASDQLTYALSQLDAAPQATIAGSDIAGTPEAAQQKQQDDARKALQSRVDSLQKTYESAQQSYTSALQARAAAVVKASDDNDPATQARLRAQADADTARAAQIKAESAEFIAASPERRATAQADARLKKAQADQAEANLAVQRETDPLKRAAAQAELDRATADTERIRAETAQVGKPAPQTPEQQRTAAAQATTAEAGASVAGGTAEAALATAQANADKARVDLENAQRASRQAPTDAQAQQAIQQTLAAAQQANDTAQFNLQQARSLAPGALAQQGANLASTQANTAATQAAIQKGVQGDLYGRREQLQQIRDMIASGDIKPEQGDQMAAALNSGTTVFDALKQQQADAAQNRSTTGSNLNQLASEFGSMSNNAFNQISSMNQYATPGSSAGADAFVAMMNMAQDRLSQYKLPDAPTTNYLGSGSPVGSMVSTAQQQIGGAPPPAAPPPPPPTPPPPSPQSTGVQPITINIGSGAASNPQPQVNPQAAGDSYSNAASTHIGGLVDQAKAKMPGTMGDVLSMGGPAFAKYLGLDRSSGPQVA